MRLGYSLLQMKPKADSGNNRLIVVEIIQLHLIWTVRLSRRWSPFKSSDLK